MGGYCASARAVASEEPIARVSQLSYTDKLLIREKRVREVPLLTISNSAIYQRRAIEGEFQGESREKDREDSSKPVG